MKTLEQLRKKPLKEETMPYSLDDKGRMDIKIPEVRDNLNTLLTGMTEKNYQNPSYALEKIRKAVANFHIHIPKFKFDDGDDGYAVFEINQFGQKMGMTDDGQFVKNMNDGLYLYFEYRLNDTGNFNIFAEVVDEAELNDLMAERESDFEDDNGDGEQEGDAVGAGNDQNYDTNYDEHKGRVMAEAHDMYHGSYTDAINTAVAHAEKKGYKLADGERDKIAMGPKKPGEGKTVSHSLALEKDGKPSKKGLHIQVYNRGGDKSPYELNHYISEEADQLDEISQEMKDRYTERAASQDSMARVQARLGTGKAKKDAEEIIRKRSRGLKLSLKEHLIKRGWKLIQD